MRAHLAWLALLALGLLAQTTFLAPLLSDGWRPDISRSLVLWLALTGVPRGGPWYAFVAGFAVDLASGAPPGITATCRLGLYGLARPGRGILEHGAVVFLLGPLAALFDGFMVWLLKSLAFANPVSATAILGVAVRQATVEMFAVPVIFFLLSLATGHAREREMTA